MCQFRVMEAGSCFHVCSQENHPVLFHNEEEFKAAMNVVAFAAFLSQGLKKMNKSSVFVHSATAGTAAGSQKKAPRKRCSCCSANEIRTRISALRGPRTKPLFDGAVPIGSANVNQLLDFSKSFPNSSIFFTIKSGGFGADCATSRVVSPLRTSTPKAPAFCAIAISV